jgi:hypothetical protein
MTKMTPTTTTTTTTAMAMMMTTSTSAAAASAAAATMTTATMTTATMTMKMNYACRNLCILHGLLPPQRHARQGTYFLTPITDTLAQDEKLSLSRICCL